MFGRFELPFIVVRRGDLAGLRVRWRL